MFSFSSAETNAVRHLFNQPEQRPSIFPRNNFTTRRSRQRRPRQTPNRQLELHLYACVWLKSEQKTPPGSKDVHEAAPTPLASEAGQTSAALLTCDAMKHFEVSEEVR